MFTRTTKKLPNRRTDATVPIIFLFVTFLLIILHNYDQNKSPRPKITTSQIPIYVKHIQIYGKHIQLKIKQRRASTHQEAVGTIFWSKGGIKGIGYSYKLEALLDGCTSVYEKGTYPFHRKIQNLVDTWNNRRNAQQLSENFHLPWVVKYQGSSKYESQASSEDKIRYSDSNNDIKNGLSFSSSIGSIETYRFPRNNQAVSKIVGVFRQNNFGVNPL